MVTPKEQGRIQVLNEVLAGTLGVGEAALLIGVSERHAWRVLAAYRRKGVAAVAPQHYRVVCPSSGLWVGKAEPFVPLLATSDRATNSALRRVIPRHLPLMLEQGSDGTSTSVG